MVCKVRWLIPMGCVLGLALVAGCSGDAAGGTENVLGMREGGQGTTFTGGDLAALCQKAADCLPAESLEGFTIELCVESLGPFFDDILAEAPPDCATAVRNMLACVAANGQCVEGELSAEACAVEDAAGTVACADWEPDIDIADYIEVEPIPVDDQTSDL